jgi:pimeloyl-ACP methyl ester carboxylesterase
MVASSVLFVHGSFFSGWTWLPVIERLATQSVDCYSVELPFTSLADDVVVLREHLAQRRRQGPVSVVCHSYTGITLSIAGHDANHLVYVAARMPAVGESQTALNADWGYPEFRSCLRIDADGQMSLADEAADFLFHRSPPNLARMAMAYRRTMRSEIPQEPVADPAWLTVPSSYVVCGDDRAVRIDQQRLRASWARHQIELDCDHSPFLSAPNELAAFIAETHLTEAS